MNRFYLAAALAATALTATSASALTPLVGAATFTLTTGLAGQGVPNSPTTATLTGGVDYDTLFSQTATTVSNFNVLIDGNNYSDFAGGVSALFNSSNGSTGSLVFSSGSSTLFAFDLSGLYSLNSAGPPPSGGNTVTVATSFTYAGTNDVRITEGSTGTLTVAAVPEPATWAMMFVGFGMMGASMRYRRKAAAVSFA